MNQYQRWLMYNVQVTSWTNDHFIFGNSCHNHCYWVPSFTLTTEVIVTCNAILGQNERKKRKCANIASIKSINTNSGNHIHMWCMFVFPLNIQDFFNKETKIINVAIKTVYTDTLCFLVSLSPALFLLIILFGLFIVNWTHCRLLSIRCILSIGRMCSVFNVHRLIK